MHGLWQVKQSTSTVEGAVWSCGSLSVYCQESKSGAPVHYGLSNLRRCHIAGRGSTITAHGLLRPKINALHCTTRYAVLTTTRRYVKGWQWPGGPRTPCVHVGAVSLIRTAIPNTQHIHANKTSPAQLGAKSVQLHTRMID